MKMKNIEIVYAINGIDAFVNRQHDANKALLSVKGQFAIKHNLMYLLGKYKPYEETLNDIKEKHDGKNSEDFNREFNELKEIEVEVDLRTISEEDFKDGTTIDDISRLEFMIN